MENKRENSSRNKAAAIVFAVLMISFVSAMIPSAVASSDVDNDEDGIDDYEEYTGHISDLDGKMYVTDNRSESTDRDPYDDGQEIDGHSPSDLGDFGGQMPARVEAPGKHPLVPSYPDLKVDIEKIDVITKTEISSETTKGTGSGWELGTEVTAGVAVETGVETQVGFPDGVSVTGHTSVTVEASVSASKSTSGFSSEEWSKATAVNSDEAAKLKFHVRIRNAGTDQAQNVRLTFNVKVGDKVIDTVWTGETPIAGLVEPGECFPEPPVDAIVIDSDKDGNEIVVTLDELKSIELGAPISVEMIEIITEVPWGKEYRDWAPYISDIDEVSARIIFDFGRGDVKDYRVWSGIRYLPGPPWETYIMNISLGDAMDWMVGMEERDDGVYIGGVKVEEWRFSFYHDTYEEVVEELGPEWTIYDLLNITLKQGWTMVVRAPDIEPPEIHWAGYTRDMKTIRVSVSDNEQVLNVTAHVKVGGSYRDVELTDEDSDMIFTATLPEEITDTYDDYVIAEDENLGTIWNNIHVMPDYWRMFGHDARHTGYSYSSAPDNNNTLWNYTTGDRVFSSPAVVYGKVFAGSEDRKIYCLDGDNGTEIWSYTTGGAVASTPAVVDDKVFVGSAKKFYCLYEDDGTERWTYTTGYWSVTSPAVADGKVFFGSYEYDNYAHAYDGGIYCLDGDDGDEIWTHVTADSVSSPAVADGKVFFGSSDHKIYCLNADTGAFIWSYTTGSWVSSSPVVVDGRVFVGSSDGKVYCLNADNGAKIWSYTIGGYVDSSTAVADGRIFVGSSGKIYCLNEDTGAFIWNYTIEGYGTSLTPAVADGRVFVGSGKIYCLDEDTGTEIWSYGFGELEWCTSPAVAEGKVFVGIEGEITYGKIYCFGSLPPTASIGSITPDTALQGEDIIEFRGNGTDEDGFVVAYQWRSFIDGILSDQKDFDMPASELSPGTHTIFFGVKDDGGLWSTQDIGYVTVESPNKAPIANFTYSPGNPLAGEEVTFNASSSYDPDDGDFIKEYEWDFGDGTNATGKMVTHPYIFGGNYTVTLAVVDNAGATDTEMKNLIVSTIKGDLNCDSEITPADALICLQIAAGSRPFDAAMLAAADVNDDGEITSLDALMILHAAAGTISL
ncbi:MAG TPA: PKD domain-containing protein [Methanosarcinales archaeon]|nr:PKD domain-containing protein [Methanosarcinales archaeon]